MASQGKKRGRSSSPSPPPSSKAQRSFTTTERDEPLPPVALDSPLPSARAPPKGSRRPPLPSSITGEEPHFQGEIMDELLYWNPGMTPTEINRVFQPAPTCSQPNTHKNGWKVFIGHIDKEDITENFVRSLCTRIPRMINGEMKILSISVPDRKAHNQPWGFAFVTFANVESAENMIDWWNKVPHGERLLKVEFATSNKSSLRRSS